MMLPARARARALALTLALAAGTMASSSAAPSTVPYKCFLALLEYCGGQTGTACDFCAGSHSAPLLAAGCSAADVTEACDTNLLRRFNLTISNTQIDDDTDAFTYQLVTYGNASAPGNLVPFSNGAQVCFDSSENPNANYFVLGAHAYWNDGGRVAIDQTLLQFRLTDDPGDPITIYTAYWYASDLGS